MDEEEIKSWLTVLVKELKEHNNNYLKTNGFNNEFDEKYIKIFDGALTLINHLTDEYTRLLNQNKKLAQCHLKYEEMTGVDLLLTDETDLISKATINQIADRLRENPLCDFYAEGVEDLRREILKSK